MALKNKAYAICMLTKIKENMKMKDLYKSENIIIRTENHKDPWNSKAELLTREYENSEIGWVWAKSKYSTLWALVQDQPDADLMRDAVHMILAELEQEEATDIDANGGNAALCEKAYNEELVITFRGRTMRMVWAPWTCDALASIIGIAVGAATEIDY